MKSLKEFISGLLVLSVNGLLSTVVLKDIFEYNISSSILINLAMAVMAELVFMFLLLFWKVLFLCLLLRNLK